MSSIKCLPLLSQMHLGVLIRVFQLLLCSVDDTGNISVSNKQATMIVSEVYYDKLIFFSSIGAGRNPKFSNLIG